MLANKEGQPIPEVIVPVRDGNDWQQLNTKELFAGKKVVVFSLPGAFTPTCSASHVPRYNQLAPDFKAAGVDEIVCVSVNDTFVMNAWKEQQSADQITFLPDGTGAFTDGMGMLVDKSAIGFGKRSWRYSMLVNDGVVEKMFVEPEVEGDPFDVSDADTMIKYLNESVKLSPEIAMITRPHCGHCTRAKNLLNEKGLAFDEIPSSPRILRAVSKELTTPRVFINGEQIGGADELEAWVKANL